MLQATAWSLSVFSFEDLRANCSENTRRSEILKVLKGLRRLKGLKRLSGAKGAEGAEGVEGLRIGLTELS